MSDNITSQAQAKEQGDEEKVIALPRGQDQTNVIEVPEGGLNGWLSVASLFLFNMATWAVNSAYAVYLAHYLQYGTFPGSTKLDYAAIGGLAFGAGLVLSPTVRIILRAWGIRITIGCGAVCQFVGIMLAAFSTKLWQVYLTQGVMMGFSLALITMPSMTVIPQWFRKKRSLAISIAASGSGVGGIIFNLAIQEIVNEHGLKWAFIVEAIVCAACTITGLILVRTRDKEIKVIMSIWDWSMLNHFCYFMFAGYVSLTLFGYVVLMYSLADFTRSLGYSAHQGSVVSCMISVGIIFGRPAVGKLADKFGAVTIALYAHMFVALLCFAMWIPARNYATAIAFALLQGATMGTIWVLFAPIAIRLFGLLKLDVCLAMTWIIIGACGIVSPIIGIKLRGVSSSGESLAPTQYLHPAIWCGVVYFASGILMWFIRAYLIARDIEAEKAGSHEDNDELYISVHWTSWIRNLFALSKTRKV